jgi:hypothetical protein
MGTSERGPAAEFVVLSLERPEGERFAIFRTDQWLRSNVSSHGATIGDRVFAMEQFVRSLELMTEDALRARLQEIGVAETAVTGHIVKARSIRQMNQGGSWELVTALGYRNEEGQLVVARTVRTGGDPEQRVFMMQCSVCGHRYGTYGSEIPRRCCPSCQDGAPGLPV